MSGNWNNPAGDFVPDGEFGELAQIGMGVAVVDSVITKPGAITINGTGAVRVNSGRDLTADTTHGESTGNLSVAAGGTLNIIGSGAVGRVSADADDLIANVTFGGVFDYDVTPASVFGTAPVLATGTASLGGALEVDFSGGASFGLSDTLSLITAPTISGGFASLAVTGSAIAAGEGSVYTVDVVADGPNQTARLTLDQVLVLDVNRETGAVAIRNPHGSAKSLDGYRINSPGGHLTPGGWSSIAPASGFLEAVSTNNNLGELNPNGSLSLTGAQPLGTAYGVNPAAEFGTGVDDLIFTYSDAAGEVKEGQVIYTGDGVTNNFRLTVNPVNGQAQLFNDSLQSVRVDSYSISSETGDLLVASWDSLTDQNVGDWVEANPRAEELAELNPAGSTLFTPGSGFNLGKIWDEVSGAQELTLEFLLDGEFTPRIGTVVFGPLGAISEPPEGLPGDFNGDGSVDAADYTVWRDNLGDASEGPLNGNGDGVNGVDAGDYQLWRGAYGASLSAAAAQTAAPEPAALSMLAAASTLLAASASRRRRNRPAGLDIQA